MNTLTNFRIVFAGSEVKFESRSGHKISMSFPEEVEVEIVYTVTTDENGEIEEDAEEVLMWYVISAPEDFACLRYTGIPMGTSFIEGKGTNIIVNEPKEIKAEIITKDEIQPGISITGVDMSQAYQFDTLNYTATVGNDVSKVTITGEIASLPDAIFEGLGEKELNVGDNTFQVTMRIPLFEGSDDYGAERTYTISITREGANTGDEVPNTGDNYDTLSNILLCLVAAITLFAVATSINLSRKKA